MVRTESRIVFGARLDLVWSQLYLELRSITNGARGVSGGSDLGLAGRGLSLR